MSGATTYRLIATDTSKLQPHTGRNVDRIVIGQFAHRANRGDSYDEYS
jgi:hypothetical protein